MSLKRPRDGELKAVVGLDTEDVIQLDWRFVIFLEFRKEDHVSLKAQLS